ncbi:MAG TPA: alpha/beta fold hydrolase [Acidimicrobiia bacterium]|nr:alpha/beta fold hydrolase [Acidimicrobiia bacterium]
MRMTMDDGVALEVTDTGSGPGLLLVHGFGGAKEDFVDHVDMLGERHRVVTFDHRGHGDSDKPSDPSAYSLDRMAADVLAVAGGMGFETFRLLGYSMGGMVARRAVLAQPARIDALVLMDTSHGPIPRLDPELAELAAGVMLDQGKEVLRPMLDEAGTLESPAHLRLLAERPELVEYEERKWEALSPVMWATMLREIVHQPDQLALLAGVRCPTLVIVGEQDAPFLDASWAMADVVPGAELVVVDDAGHSPQLENPSAWLDVLQHFLARVERAPAA